MQSFVNNDEIEIIKQQFREVITFSQGIDNPKVDKLFDMWLAKKKDFIIAFGNQLIYEFPNKVQFYLTDAEKDSRINEFIIKLDEEYEYYDLARFVDHMRESFFNNITDKDFMTCDDIVIKAGTKIIKSFKYFNIEPCHLEDLQNEASRIIQENCIEGYLCFSVHPLDFLSTAETTHKWRSCHALDGEHRSGNLSYMVDNSTIIAYLRSEDKDVKLPRFPGWIGWNSKKWRTLLYFSDDRNMIMAGRQYPIASQNGLDEILKSYLPTALSHNRNGDNCFRNLDERHGNLTFTPWYNSYGAEFELNHNERVFDSM